MVYVSSFHNVIIVSQCHIQGNKFLPTLFKSARYIKRCNSNCSEFSTTDLSDNTSAGMVMFWKTSWGLEMASQITQASYWLKDIISLIKRTAQNLNQYSGPHWDYITTLSCFIVIRRYSLLWYILNLIELYLKPLSYKQHRAARRALKTPCSDPRVRRL